MKFRQFEDGGGMLMFNEEEVKILSEKKCLTFDAEFFKHFKNELMGTGRQILKDLIKIKNTQN